MTHRRAALFSLIALVRWTLPLSKLCVWSTACTGTSKTVSF